MHEELNEKYQRGIRFRERERFQSEIPVVVAETSVSPGKLRKMRMWQKRRLFQKGEKFLKGLGAEVVVPTVSSGLMLGIPAEERMTVETNLSVQDMPMALENVLAECRESPAGKTGWVLSQDCREECLPMLIAMSRKMQYLGIVTKNRERAERMEEILCEEYGADLEIRAVLPWTEQQNTLVSDLDRGRILTNGKAVLEGRILALDLHEYRIDLSKLLNRCPELWEMLSPVGWSVRKSG